MAGRTRIKAEAVQGEVPQSHDEAVDAIAEIGRLQRQRERIAAAMNDELAVIRQRYEAEAKPLGERIRERTLGVQVWCEAHRDELTRGGKTKTAHLASGTVHWRMRPPSVAIRGIELVLDALRRFGLERFIRTREEVNKEAILQEPEAVKDVRGISITQREDFVIVPFETELEEVV